MIPFLKNLFGASNRYKNHSEAIIVSCFYNPQNSQYRLRAFHEYYKSIKHMNHLIVECVIGGASPQLDGIAHITVSTETLLWHKECLLNEAIRDLPSSYKYIFWIDADVLFTNKNWLVDSVAKMKAGANVVQPFEYCVHLERDEHTPDFDYQSAKQYADIPTKRNKMMWRSFAYNYEQKRLEATSTNYDLHGHVGFAWGAKREILNAVPLYDKALVGGADHIIAHAAAGQVPHKCITHHFKENIDEIIEWSSRFSRVVQGRLAAAPGDLFHIWHGDVSKREYGTRIKAFGQMTNRINKKDENGLYVCDDVDTTNFIDDYFQRREVSILEEGFKGFGGGSGGGGGAGGDWSSDPKTELQNDREGDGIVLGVVTALDNMDTNHDGHIDSQDVQTDASLEGGDIQGAIDSNEYGSTFS
jgi:hypothetical protein